MLVNVVLVIFFVWIIFLTVLLLKLRNHYYNLISKTKKEKLDDILDLREGDRLGSGARKTSWRLEEFKSRMIEQLNQPMEVKDLQINGHDLMTEFNLKPGPILREILLWLLEKILDKPELNNKADLLKLVKEYVQK